ncbi:MAG: polysaccharide deacetylase family protein [Bacteroidales bacterium]|nr:polysaccharide deacetylase family protein [Bacteroidales bacterium]MDD4603272.1 polysaccharide deacetylase family protein [Bacteroidales bacterium]
MFTFKRFTVIFFILLLVLNLWSFFACHQPDCFLCSHLLLCYFLVFVIYFGVSVAMAFVPRSNFHYPVISSGNTDQPWVSLTFDDGPNPEKTPFILEILKKYNLKATFFCPGKNIQANMELATRIHEEGHIIGNHSFSHSKWFDFIPAYKMKAELLKTDQLIRDVTGKSPLFFRPPYGVINPMVSKTLRKMHWEVICWNIWSMDTLNLNSSKTMNKIISLLKPGGIILVHDHTTFIQQNLEALIQNINRKGFMIVPLDQLLKMKAYA